MRGRDIEVYGKTESGDVTPGHLGWEDSRRLEVERFVVEVTRHAVQKESFRATLRKRDVSSANPFSGHHTNGSPTSRCSSSPLDEERCRVRGRPEM